MNKTKRNRKLVAQNQRNRIMNRRYSSTIKTLFKVFLLKLKGVHSENLTGTNDSNLKVKTEQKIEINLLLNKIYSIIDKAIKKKVLHKNNAARKKSKLGKLVSVFN